MNHLLPQTYIDAVERCEEPISNTELITPQLSMGETMMLGLRLLQEGVNDTDFEERYGIGLETTFGSRLSELSEHGLLPDWDSVRARLTKRGTLLANNVCSRFL